MRAPNKDNLFSLLARLMPCAIIIMIAHVAALVTGDPPQRYSVQGVQWHSSPSALLGLSVKPHYALTFPNKEASKRPLLVSFHHVPKEVDLEVKKKSKARPRRFVVFACIQVYIPLERSSHYDASQCDFGFQMTRAGPQVMCGRG